MAAESSFSKGLGWGCGIYLGISIAALAIPLGMFVMCCGGCAAFTTGTAGLASIGKAEADAEAARQRAAKASVVTSTPIDKPELESPPVVPSGTGDEPIMPPEAPSPEPEPAPKPMYAPQVPILPSELPDSTDLRTFSSANGSYTVKAKYLRFKVTGSLVVLRKEDGKEIEVKMAMLSPIDQDWIKAENKRRADERKGVANKPVPSSPTPEPEPEPMQTLPENAGSVSLENFYAVKTGMSSKEVFALLGNAGSEIISEAEVAGIRAVMVQWTAPKGFGANCNVMFQNGKVVSKAQFGLK